MKKIFTLIIFVSAYYLSNGQCSEVSVSVSSSDTTSIQLYHPGFFNIPSGFDNICDWEVSTTSGDIVFEDITQGMAFEQGQVIFDHTVPITDSLFVSIVINNSIEGIICTIIDTIFWEETEVLPETFIGNWAVLNPNGGVEEQITAVTNSAINENRIKLFPSPVENYFQIEGTPDLSSLSILHLNGQIMKTYNDIQPLQKVDVSDLSPGIYLVKLWENDSTSLGFKRIVIH